MTQSLFSFFLSLYLLHCDISRNNLGMKVSCRVEGGYIYFNSSVLWARQVRKYSLEVSSYGMKVIPLINFFVDLI
ncbi:hypothetical protein C2G38_2128944 [Gigaspora rosea]|uniref:Ig-like domain-containing protein n=1 Tax=Gigaspora rosea TaxID=44941 RepID=A0A397TSV9_9GLOM|nr:hypothetical protein C2G38_2128944 [Gigaspora rosea]